MPPAGRLHFADEANSPAKMYPGGWAPSSPSKTAKARQRPFRLSTPPCPRAQPLSEAGGRALPPRIAPPEPGVSAPATPAAHLFLTLFSIKYNDK